MIFLDLIGGTEIPDGLIPLKFINEAPTKEGRGREWVGLCDLGVG